MRQNDLRAQLIAAATPLFAKKGLNGVSVRELARACNTNISMISYHFGGKAGLYEAVLAEVFADMLEVAKTAESSVAPLDKFKAYVYRCGICFHSGAPDRFAPRTASADPAAPECPRCLNNDAATFSEEPERGS